MPSLEETRSRPLVDISDLNNFLKKEKEDGFSIKYDQESGWLKAINSKPNLIFRVSKNIQVVLDEWHGTLDFSFVPMDYYVSILSMDFINNVKVGPIPFANTMCILKESTTCSIPLVRDDDMPLTLAIFEEVEIILAKFKGVMPKELPKKLPPKREVDLSKFEPRARLPFLVWSITTKGSLGAI
ncbi:hypothetical protein GH714_040971 [Hevea brasiliensis]|uniref:Uncharacterized protein n=1 Tax=Hevea brasiliensis TaxID=3981 RepID=A0A6A6MV86_HEVBR|nr:hypothetical protein GH714_040971 [Hevea brasiliensis]